MNLHFVWLTMLFFLSACVWKWIFRVTFTQVLPYPPAAAFLGA